MEGITQKRSTLNFAKEGNQNSRPGTTNIFALRLLITTLYYKVRETTFKNEDAFIMQWNPLIKIRM